MGIIRGNVQGVGSSVRVAKVWELSKGVVKGWSIWNALGEGVNQKGLSELLPTTHSTTQHTYLYAVSSS